MLALIAEGLSNVEIAGRLVVSEGTVKSHINHIFAKIGARDRAQAVSYAYQRGFAASVAVTPPPRVPAPVPPHAPPAEPPRS